MTMKRLLALAAISIALPNSEALRAQVSISIGAGAGIAGGTESSLSDGKGGWIAMGQVTTTMVPLIRAGVEVNHFQTGDINANFGTAILQARLPAVPFFVKIGVGYGRGDFKDADPVATGIAGEFGLGYSIGFPGVPVGIDIFGNALFAHGSSRSAQMVAGGLAIRFP
ncbi:MAG TPA: hypothetical protein VK636_22370 [Gemmatimonadaceae bacterium]|nr:hypothetical protein [Gemmatimonadaceae bacterium]